MGAPCHGLPSLPVWALAQVPQHPRPQQHLLVPSCESPEGDLTLFLLPPQEAPGGSAPGDPGLQGGSDEGEATALPKGMGEAVWVGGLLWLPCGNTLQHVAMTEHLVPLTTHRCLPDVGGEAHAASFLH